MFTRGTWQDKTSLSFIPLGPSSASEPLTRDEVNASAILLTVVVLLSTDIALSPGAFTLPLRSLIFGQLQWESRARVPKDLIGCRSRAPRGLIGCSVIQFRIENGLT